MDSVMANTYETIFYNSDLPTENLGEVIAWLNEQYLKIPLEYRHTAKIEIDAGTEWDYPYPEIRIRYLRPVTDEEIEERRRCE